MGYSNGIFPRVEHEPLGEAKTSIIQSWGLRKEPCDNDMSLTPIIVSNHTSYLDGAILAVVFGAPKIVAKAGARKAPIFGKLMEEMEVVFVDRSNGDSRQQTLEAIKTHCTEWSPGSRPLLIFPEGTTTNGE